MTMPLLQSAFTLFYIMIIGGIIGIGISVLLIIYFIRKFLKEEKLEREGNIEDLD